MNHDYAVRSDFLIHWTGKDLDEKYDPDWYTHRKSTATRDSRISQEYVKRLREILKYGLWLTSEGEINFQAGDTKVQIPDTPKICFTELKLSESRSHAKMYGRLGIGVKRPFLFDRSGRPLAYYGYHNSNSRDTFLKACAEDLKDKSLLNFFKPMNSSYDLNYDLYSESEWRILFFEHLLKKQLIKDPRDPSNVEEHKFFMTLSQGKQEKLKYLVPLDGWFSLIIYPSHWVKNMSKQNASSEVEEQIRRIKGNTTDHGNRVEGGNWPIEVDLDACRHF